MGPYPKWHDNDLKTDQVYCEGVTMLKKWKWISIVSSIALAVAVAGVWLFAATPTANAAVKTTQDLQSVTQSTTLPGLLGEGYLGHGGRGGPGFGGSIDYQQLLADALEIPVEQLLAAYETARVAALEQAVDLGLITQERADERLVWGGMDGKWLDGLRGLGGRRSAPGIQSRQIDENALLAEALGITTDELAQARERANQAALDQAVAEGLITQEQADEMLQQKQRRETLQGYLGRDALLAQALGMTVDELQAAYAKGESLSDLMSEQGLDAVTVREQVQAAHEAALAQAVEDGVLTQEQADQMSGMPLGRLDARPSRGWPGFPGRENGSHRDGFPGMDRFGDGCPQVPDTDGSDGTDGGTSGTSLRVPGRMMQQSGAL
jgi:hypothetical protein